MKTAIITSILALMILSSCTYDKKNLLTISNLNDTTKHPIVCTDTVLFSVTLQPIINNSCAIAGCHVGHGHGGVNALDYTQFTNIQAEDSAIYTRLTYPVTKTDTPAFMPKNASPLTQAQIQAFYCWWKQGALNN